MKRISHLRAVPMIVRPSHPSHCSHRVTNTSYSRIWSTASDLQTLVIVDVITDQIGVSHQLAPATRIEGRKPIMYLFGLKRWELYTDFTPRADNARGTSSAYRSVQHSKLLSVAIEIGASQIGQRKSKELPDRLKPLAFNLPPEQKHGNSARDSNASHTAPA